MNTEKQIKNYIQRQKNWIKANNLQPGDKVKILKEHPSRAKGYENDWTPGMTTNIGKVGIYRECNMCKGRKGLIIDVNNEFHPFHYPYTVLQKVD